MRKIMIEVTPQEYEKIQAGKLNADDMTVEQLVHQLIKKLNADDNVLVHHNIEPFYISHIDTYDFKIHNSIRVKLEIEK